MIRPKEHTFCTKAVIFSGGIALMRRRAAYISCSLFLFSSSCSMILGIAIRIDRPPLLRLLPESTHNSM